MDITSADVAPLEAAQLSFLRRVLEVNPRSMRAFLFSETGVMPIRHRRLVLGLRALKYYMEGPPGSYTRLAVAQAMALAEAGYVSWVTWLETALLRIGIENPLARRGSLFNSTEAVDVLIAQVTELAHERRGS